VASFGENLRQARTARNITLQEIAATTKISSRALQALEDEHFEQLPGGIFNKGFVRAYARCIGLDEEETIAAYLVAANVSPSEIDMEVMSTQVAAAAGTGPWSPSAASVVGVLAILVALGMGGLWLNEQRKEARELATHRAAAESASPIPPAQSAVTATEPNPVPATGTDASANQAAGNAGAATPVGATPSPGTPATPTTAASSARETPQSTNSGRQTVGVSAVQVGSASVASRTGAVTTGGQSPVEVSISATARVWISVRSDGKTVETLTLDPEKPESRSRSYTAKEKLLLVVGNPAGLSVTYNGKPTGVLGASGQRAMITFTPQGMEKQ
jgi:cytoskeleton protein RodZ